MSFGNDVIYRRFTKPAGTSKRVRWPKSFDPDMRNWFAYPGPKKENPSGEGMTTELGGVENVSRAMKRATSVEITKLEKYLTFLATTASAAPFIGLFGTVWGIMNAFRGLSVTHSSSIQAVAPGIAEALIATADRFGGCDSPLLWPTTTLSSRSKCLPLKWITFPMSF